MSSRACPQPVPAGIAAVVRLAWPATMHLLLVTLVFIADRVLIGRHDAAQLASLQISSTISWSLVSVAAALAVGAGARVARAVGAQQLQRARESARLSLVGAATLGVALCAGGAVATPALVGLVSGGDVQIEYAAINYLLVLLPALPFALVEAVAVAVLHATGDTRTPLRAAVVGNIINLAISSCLVFGWAGLPALGVVGAAIGTAVALTVQALWVVRALWRHRVLNVAQRHHPSWPQQLQHDMQQAVSLWRVVWPAASERALYHAGYLVYAGTVTTLGAAAMAANQTLISIEAIGFTVAEGCGIAAATLAGQYLGAGRPQQAQRVCFCASFIAASVLALIGVAMMGMPSSVIALFSDDPNVIASGAAALPMAAFAQPFMAAATVMGMALRGVGRTRTALLTTIVCTVFLRLALSGWLLLEGGGLAALWIASGCDWVLHAVLLGLVWLRLPRTAARPRAGRSVAKLSLLLFCLAACANTSATILQPQLTGLLERSADNDWERVACQLAISRAERIAAAPGTPKLDLRRAEVLGRALAEPVVFVRPPRTTETALPASNSGVAAVDSTQSAIALSRMLRAAAGNKAKLRQRVLREGYLYSDDPYTAFALVKRITLTSLFDAPEIWLQRGQHHFRLTRTKWRRGQRYTFADGERRGTPARLLLFDRVAEKKPQLAEPLHRDIRALRDRVGFERVRSQHLTDTVWIADLRFGPDKRWVRALLESQGAELRLSCLDADIATREAITQWRQQDEPRRRALARLRQTIGQMVAERLPFDRPRGATDHLSDGRLRPLWRWAYKTGRSSFMHEEKGYLVFDPQGRPNPPQVCIEMIVDTFERSSGSWYAPRGQSRQRSVGGIDFGELGIKNRAGVLAFETFAKTKPDHFETRRIAQAERLPFAKRKAFFAYLVEHADDFAAADVVSIQGRKRDGYIHQHAILIEDVDPMTGFPYALVDQMKWPRQRTWETIMAEAPQRALLYQVRLREQLLLKLALPAAGKAAPLTAASR